MGRDGDRKRERKRKGLLLRQPYKVLQNLICNYKAYFTVCELLSEQTWGPVPKVGLLCFFKYRLYDGRFTFYCIQYKYAQLGGRGSRYDTTTL